jgi:DUF4097 and DUF4098 domain-containing protein YvlB
MTGAAAGFGANQHGPASRRFWLAAGVVVVVAFVGWGGATIGSLLGHQSVHHRRVFAGPVRELDLHVSNGSITVMGSDSSQTIVDAAGDRGITSPSDDETLSGGILTVHSGCGFAVITDNWCGLSYRITVSRNVEVIAQTSDGSVKVTGISGALDLSSSDGRLHVDSPTGPLKLHTSDGAIRVTNANTSVAAADSSDGSIHLGFRAPPQSVTAHSSDGSVTVGLPNTPDSYHVTAHSSDGSVHNDVRTFSGSQRTITVTSSDGNVTVSYGTG